MRSSGASGSRCQRALVGIASLLRRRIRTESRIWRYDVSGECLILALISLSTLRGPVPFFVSSFLLHNPLQTNFRFPLQLFKALRVITSFISNDSSPKSSTPLSPLQTKRPLAFDAYPRTYCHNASNPQRTLPLCPVQQPSPIPISLATLPSHTYTLLSYHAQFHHINDRR